ncbi:RING zinc finger protein-like protein [Pyrenochaeta sp. DS3sAY3a]|nr:RING zinc finger protein-like protein [Pyrenochaeta sp. DS3sAY3a]
MSKRTAKSQASSARADATGFGSPAFGAASSSPAFGASSSQLSYVSEPPVLSAVSDPNVVVYFRNLSKKDSTTKAKALEELLAYLAGLKEPVEEGILEAWIRIYPRTSIDNAKAVRQNAHTVHGQIALSAGKRIAKHMPQTVAAWLCGLYDSDRSVVDATQRALRHVFTTPDKIQSIRRVYQQPILEYCRDAIDKESPATLSDERTVSQDDADAKYSRVISACIALLASLLGNLSSGELSKFEADYEGVLGDKKLWDFASHSDASIRRSVHRLLKTWLAKQPEAVEAHLETISKSYLSVALNSDQMSSIYDYIEVLTLLTAAHPSVWTTNYKSKTGVDRRLRQFLKKGSQLGPRDFWVRLTELFRALPSEVIPRNAADAVELLKALHSGITRKDEPKFNHEAAFGAYLDIVHLISQNLQQDDRTKLLEEMVLPLVTQYLRPSLESSDWTVPSNATRLLPKALSIPGMVTTLTEKWPTFAQQLIDDIKTSAPEQSKDYEMSQAAVVEQATRFATLKEEVLKDQQYADLRPVLDQTYASIISSALTVLKSRDGKPYGAAGAVAALLSGSRATPVPAQIEDDVEAFVRRDLTNLLSSPSSPYLIEILYSLADTAAFKDAWSAVLKSILKEEVSPARTKALDTLLTSARIPPSFDLPTTDEELQKYIISNVQEAIEGSTDWDSFLRVLQSRATIMSPKTTDEVLAQMTQSLSIAQNAQYSLHGLRQIVKSNPSLLRDFLTTPQGSKLLQSLLLASESPNDSIAQDATAINASIQTMLSSASETRQSIYDLIHQGLREATSASVSVQTLVDLAKQSLKGKNDWSDIEKILPNPEEWTSSLAPLLGAAPKQSLSITNPIHGAVYLVKDDQDSLATRKLPRDADGYSAAYRIAQYVTRLLKNPELVSVEVIPVTVRDTFLRNIALTVQLAADNLGLAGANDLWAQYNPDVEAEAMSFLSDAQQFTIRELQRLAQSWDNSDSNPSLLAWAMELLSTMEDGFSAQTYYLTRAYCVTLADAVESGSWKSSNTPQLQEILKTIRKTKEIFPLLGFLNAFKEPLAASRSCERMCNEIIADLTGLDVAQKPRVGLEQLVVLNALLGQEGITESIAKQRLIFFVKHVTSWLQDTSVLRSLKAELCRALLVLLPIISDMYGEHWGDILHYFATSWSATQQLEENQSVIESPIPLVHASLKLYAQLRTMKQAEEPNDDLVDAWKETEQPIADGLINLLKHSQHFPDEFHQPLKMVNDVLARQIAKVSLKNLESTEELYPLLYVESQPVQQTAFDILHKQIPIAQEQISIDTVLEKTTARLPEELLSLIIDAPTVAALGDANFERNVPLPLRGYLLSWLLVFDHLEHSSFKVKNDYVEHIKEGDYLPGLLNFMFDFLGHAHSKPVDVTKLDITEYVPDVEPPKRDLQWLLTHLYFLCLRHVPSLTKSWFMGCKSRPTVVTLEPWTEKFISPPVISAALQSVSSWSDEQAASDSDSPFSVKVAPRAKEITASYTVDEQTMSMRIALPPAFPLSNAHIEGLNRVAVNEQKWQSWLRTSLGAITIFNGSLIDALTTFKRNVDGAMKGQTECAICYSIVGSDRKLPDKRCQTCKNLFHGSCLFKWFRTSGSSSCPLCRNPFNYG